jgi:hypothetical protein
VPPGLGGDFDVNCEERATSGIQSIQDFPFCGALLAGRDHDVATGSFVGLRLFCGAENLYECSNVSLDNNVRMFVELTHGNDGCSHEGVE